MSLADALDLFEERAAIREFDGGQSRHKAEHHAAIEAAEAYGLKPHQIRAGFSAPDGLRKVKNRHGQ